ncbi:MAG TPA: hypothetical protein VLT17_03905, partial [Gemmatimonadales bacterium]|nr:hypothetical protein [Gemmatimonadales bacterium]
FMAAVLANGGGFYHPFAYVAEAMRMGLTVRPPDINASEERTTGRGREVRIGFQFVKGLTASAVQKIAECRAPSAKCLKDPIGNRQSPIANPYTSLPDLAARTGLTNDDLRLLIKVGALDSIAHGWTRPMMLWWVDGRERGTGERENGRTGPELSLSSPSPDKERGTGGEGGVPALREYTIERKRREEYELLDFTTDTHPIRLYADRLQRFRLCRSTELDRHVGKSVLLAGMLTTSKPVHTIKDEPMEFATFDDGDGLIETVLFPDLYRERGHVLFDQGPFIFRGKVEQEFGAVTVTITQLDRLERMLDRVERTDLRSSTWPSSREARRDR